MIGWQIYIALAIVIIGIYVSVCHIQKSTTQSDTLMIGRIHELEAIMNVLNERQNSQIESSRVEIGRATGGNTALGSVSYTLQQAEPERSIQPERYTAPVSGEYREMIYFDNVCDGNGNYVGDALIVVGDIVSMECVGNGMVNVSTGGNDIYVKGLTVRQVAEYLGWWNNDNVRQPLPYVEHEIATRRIK